MRSGKALPMSGIIFIAAIILAVVLPLVAHYLTVQFIPEWIWYILVFIAGLGIGVFCITKKEKTAYLLATLALTVVGVSGFATIPYIGEFLGVALGGIALLNAPAAVLIAISMWLELAKD